jgi:hypothetical protein
VQLWDAILAAAAKQQKQQQQQQHRKQALHHQRGTPTTARPHAPAAVLATTSTTPSAAAPLAPWASITAARTRGDLQTQPPPAAVAARARSAPTAESSSSSRTPHHHKAKTATIGGGAATSTHKPKGSVGAPRKPKQHQQRQENTNWASDQRYIAFRGKERETPKPTKPSKLKRVILLERAKADALLQPQPPAPTPPGAPGLEKDQPCDREQLTAPTQSAHADHPDQSDDGDISQTHSSKETNASETVVAPGDIDIDYDSPPPSPPPGAAQVQSIDAT